MIILGIETSGSIGSVAVCRDDQELASYTMQEGALHSREVVPGVDAVISEAGLSRSEIDGIAVSQGPGSFNGLRVGVTCAKTLAYALGCKVVGVPSLEVLVQNVPTEAAQSCPYVCPVLDARRQRVYGTIFRWDGSRWRDTTGVLLKEPKDLADAIPEGALVFGSGVRAYPTQFSAPPFRIGDQSLELARAQAAAWVGWHALRSGGEQDSMALAPQYYRVTAPEEKLQRKADA